MHLSRLSFGIRLLLESSAAENVRIADHLLTQFGSEIVAIHDGNERIETINVQCLKHLPDQVKRFGPLFCYSAMSFESANRMLGDNFSGSNSECEIICRRILQKHKLSDEDIKDSELRQLFNKLSGRPIKDTFASSDEMKQTEALTAGQRQYPYAVFLNRLKANDTYFDSEAFSRSKLGNCFISYLENGEDSFGKIQYFVKIPNQPYFDEVQANVRLYAKTEDVGLVKGYVFRVQETSRENLIPVFNLEKVFQYSENKESKTFFMMKLCATFDHS